MIAVAVVTGCTETADINEYVNASNEVTLLVVNAEISTDTMAHSVTLTKSSNVTNSNPIQVFSNAIVSITDGTQVFNLHENPLKPGTYLTDSTVYGIPGNTYTLNISNVDLYGNGVMQSFTASSELRKINPIDSIYIQYISQSKNFKGWFIDLYAKDIGGGINYYLPKAYKNNVLLTDSMHKYDPGNNISFNDTTYNGLPVIFLNQNITENDLMPGDKVTLELDGITEGYYNFIEAFIMQFNPKIPLFSGPSANIPTNIYPQNKAAGFFAVYSIQRKSIIYK
jgi:hypothetical protein